MVDSVVALIPAYSHIDWRLNAALRKFALPVLSVHGCSDLVKARSRLLTDALKSDAQRFLFIDADMVPTLEQLERLIRSELVGPQQSVTGCYFTQPGFVAAVAADNSPLELNGAQRFVKGIVAGMGFASVHRETVQQIASCLPEVTDARGDRWHPFFLPFIAEHEVEGSGVVSEYYPEDYSFWWRVKALGKAQLWIDTHMVVGHVRQVVLGAEHQGDLPKDSAIKEYVK